ncbi:MAG: MFS transporter [Pseudomonadales bacterium]|nr:MFS transporter [Pseudomonadales bacterium]
MLEAKGFLLAGAVSFVGTVVRTGALFSIVPLIGTMQLNLTATQIGIAMGVGSLLGVMVSYPAGILVDRIGRKSVIVPATIASGCSFILYGFAPDYIWFILACAFWGVASSASGSAPAAAVVAVNDELHSI